MRRRHRLRVDTFPFLAVLLCAMGALILILLVMDRRSRLAALARGRENALLVAHQERREPEGVVGEDDARLEAERKALDEEMRQVQARLAEVARDLQKEEEGVGNLRRKVVGKRSSLNGHEKAYQSAQKEAADLKTTLTAEDRARHALAAELVQLEEVIRDLKSTRQRDALTYSVIPYKGKHGEQRRPLYVECTRFGHLFHPDRFELIDPSLERLRLEIARRVTRIAENRRRAGLPDERPYLMMLIRPEGIMRYYQVQSAVRELPVEFGYEFVDADWVLHVPPEVAELAGTAEPSLSKPSPDEPIRMPGSGTFSGSAGEATARRPGWPGGNGGTGGSADSGGSGGTPGGTGFGLPGDGTGGSAGLTGNGASGGRFGNAPGGIGGGGGSGGRAGSPPSNLALLGLDGTGGNGSSGSLAGRSRGNSSSSGPGDYFNGSGGPSGSGNPGRAMGGSTASGPGGPLGDTFGGAGGGGGFGGRADSPPSNLALLGLGGAGGSGGSGSLVSGLGGSPGGTARGRTGPGPAMAGLGDRSPGLPHSGAGEPNRSQPGLFGMQSRPGGGTQGASSSPIPLPDDGSGRIGKANPDGPTKPLFENPLPPATSEAVAKASSTIQVPSILPSTAGAATGGAGNSSAGSGSGSPGSGNTSAGSGNASSGGSGSGSEGSSDGPPVQGKPRPQREGFHGSDSLAPSRPPRNRPLLPARIGDAEETIVFVECRSAGVVVHPVGQSIPLAALDQPPASNALLRTVMAQLAMHKGHPTRRQVRFLIHRDADRTFHAAYPVLEDVKVDKTRYTLQPGDDVSHLILVE